MNGLQYHRKGRTARRRTKRTYSTKLDNLSCEPSIIVLVQWMCNQGWKATSKLRLANTFITGRGLQTLNGVKTRDILVRIPEKLLITSNTACNRLRIDSSNVQLSEQVLLTVFIVLEINLGSDSPLYPYLQTLPKTFTVPTYCSDNEITHLPPFMQNRVLEQKRSLEKAFANGCEFIKSLISSGKVCASYPDLSFGLFKFAWFVVNTRAVYMSSGDDHNIIKDVREGNLALAPYLDMFNHSFDVRVEAGFNHLTKSYEIRSLTPYPPKSQVFINYGPHDNMKLWIEYGFYLSHNPHDVVTFSFDDVFAIAKRCLQTSVLPMPKMDFLRGHGLLENLNCSVEGLSWSLSALIAILCLEDADKSAYYKVFRGDWVPFESRLERQLALEIVTCKNLELIEALRKMQELRSCSDSFRMATGILEEYVNILSSTVAKYKDLCKQNELL